MAITNAQQARQLYIKGGQVNPDGRLGFNMGGAQFTSGGNISPGTDKRGNVRDDNPLNVFDGAPPGMNTAPNPINLKKLEKSLKEQKNRKSIGFQDFVLRRLPLGNTKAKLKFAQKDKGILDYINSLSEEDQKSRALMLALNDPGIEIDGKRYEDFLADDLGLPSLKYSGDIGNLRKVKKDDGTFEFIEGAGDSRGNYYTQFKDNNESILPIVPDENEDEDEIVNYRLMADGGRIGFNMGGKQFTSGDNISPGTDVKGNIREDNPFVGREPEGRKVNLNNITPPVKADSRFNFGKTIGKGLPPKELARLFNEFYNLNTENEPSQTVVSSGMDGPSSTVYSLDMDGPETISLGSGLAENAKQDIIENKQLGVSALSEAEAELMRQGLLGKPVAKAEGGRIGLKDGEGIMQMASAPDPMDERNSMMETIAREEFGKPLSDLTEDEIIQIEMFMEEMDTYGSSSIMDKYKRYIQEMINTNNEPLDFEEFKKMIEESERTMAQAGGRIGLMEGGMPYEGGIMDLESGRQQYFLGKLVKKATRAVKKIAKSPIGKAALLYFGGQALSGLGGGQGIMANLFGTAAQGAKRMPGIGGPLFKPATDGILGKLGLTKGGGSMGLTTFSKIGIPTALSYFMTPKQEDDDDDETLYAGADLPNSVDYYLSGKYSPNRRLVAEGGSMDEPVAKKTMPLLDMDGQEMDLRAEGGFVPLGRMEKADDVPARLSKNEFVFTADAVRNAGEGDVDKGAEVMYNMMKNLESGGEVSEESQGLEGAREMFQTSQRLEEVI